MNTQLAQTPVELQIPVELIEYYKALERVALPTYIEKRGTTAGHDWILIGANEAELQKLGFSPAFWTTITELWIVPGRQHLGLIELTGAITDGFTEPRDKAKAIGRWIYENVEYELNQEAPPWDLIRPGVSGDCSSFAPLAATLLGIVGIKCWLKQTAFWQEETYSHVYVLAQLPDGWAVIDPTSQSYFSRGVKNVSAYGLFEIDETFGATPPVTGPDQPKWWPELPSWYEIRAMMPWLINMGLALGLVVAVSKK